MLIMGTKTAETKLREAISNNNDLYGEVFNSWELEFTNSALAWYSIANAPAYYSNIVTRSRNWTPDGVFDAVAAHLKGKNWAIKDSFGILDLEDHGFDKLLQAQWLYLPHQAFRPLPSADKLSYAIVRTPAQLAAWNKTWNSGHATPVEGFRESLLKREAIAFIAGYNDSKTMSGCLLNKTAGVWGISNFFAPDGGLQYWSDMIAFIFDTVEYADLVGFQSPRVSDSLRLLGFEQVGGFTVWGCKAPCAS